MKIKKTLADIAAMDKELLTAADIAGVMGKDPQTIRCQAHDPYWREQFEIPVFVFGRQVRFPKRRVLEAYGWYDKAH